MNVGEEIVESYLKCIKGCEFVQKNLDIPNIQGEIDIVGIDLNKKLAYICEVAVHLQFGLRYTKNGSSNNVNKLKDKFSKNIKYANEYFSDYTQIFMLWSPIVKEGATDARDNQLQDVKQVQEYIRQEYNTEIELIINDKFLECFDELREFVRNKTSDLKSPVLRLLQIEEASKKHKERMDKKNTRIRKQ